LSHLVPSFSKLTASTIVGNMTATSKTFGYLGVLPTKRTFRTLLFSLLFLYRMKNSSRE